MKNTIENPIGFYESKYNDEIKSDKAIDLSVIHFFVDLSVAKDLQKLWADACKEAGQYKSEANILKAKLSKQTELMDRMANNIGLWRKSFVQEVSEWEPYDASEELLTEYTKLKEGE